MKKIIFIFLASLITLFPNTLKSQILYTEQTSGVTTSLNSVCMYPTMSPSQVWACGNSGVILRTTNQGINWVNVSTGWIPSNFTMVSISSKAIDTALAVATSTGTGSVYRTVNGTTWNFVFSQPLGFNAVWMRDGRNGFLAGTPFGGRWSLWKTTNAGLNWDSSGLYLPQAGSEYGFANSLFMQNDTIWMGTNNSRIYKSTNYGHNWTIISTGPEVNSSILWFPQSPYSWYSPPVFGGSNLYYSSNWGLNWLMSNCPGTGNFVGYCGGAVGASDYALGPGYAIRGNSNIYVGNSFPNMIPDYTAPAGIYYHMAPDYAFANYTWAVRSNGGITKIQIMRGGGVRNYSSEIPVKYSLEQNYPNPFNPVTRIRFSIPKSGFTSIKLFDIKGREVRTIVNESLRAGEYETDFDAASLASGVYFYRIQTGEFLSTKKMILLK